MATLFLCYFVYRFIHSSVLCASNIARSPDMASPLIATKLWELRRSNLVSPNDVPEYSSLQGGKFELVQGQGGESPGMRTGQVARTDFSISKLHPFIRTLDPNLVECPNIPQTWGACSQHQRGI